MGLKKWGDSLTTVPDEAIPPYPEDVDHGLYFHQLKYLPEGTKISDRPYDKPGAFTKDIFGWVDLVSGKTLSEDDFTDDAFWAITSFPEPFDRTLTQLEEMAEFERVIDAEGDVWEFDGEGNSKVLYSTNTPPGYSSAYEPIGMMGEYGPFAVLSS